MIFFTYTVNHSMSIESCLFRYRDMLSNISMVYLCECIICECIFKKKKIETSCVMSFFLQCTNLLRVNYQGEKLSSFHFEFYSCCKSIALQLIPYPFEKN